MSLALTASTGAASGTEVLRYRGDYTLGHEVNIFCPQVNSRCYWLDPSTPMAIRQALQTLAAAHSEPPHSPVCLVVEGTIDRTSSREGFAADYEGLFTMTEVYGACNRTQVIAQGDLQHHRWVLTRIGDQPVSRANPHTGPALEIGEKMFFEAHDHSHSVSGFSRLAGEHIIFEADRATPTRFPDSAITDFDVTALPGKWRITRPSAQMLLLERATRRLEFTLSDWR